MMKSKQELQDENEMLRHLVNHIYKDIKAQCTDTAVERIAYYDITFFKNELIETE